MSDYDYSSKDYGNVDRSHDTGWNLKVSDKKNNSELDSSDFLNLMISQLKNQDFMNPMDNTEYVTQMAQFNSMQVMSELASYSKTNYAMSLVGKDVTATKFKFNGDLDTETGPVQKVSLVNNEYVIYVKGKKYSLDQIMEVKDPLEEGECVVDPSKMQVASSEVTDTGVKLKWSLPTEDTATAKTLQYKIFYTPVDENNPDQVFNTIESVEKGTQAGSTLKELTEADKLTMEIAGLQPGTDYYMNVLVVDPNGNKAVYKPVKITTKHS